MSNRVELPFLSPWLAALPLLFAPRRGRDNELVASLALGSAAAALAADPDRRDSRSRLCFLLAELACQYARRTGDHDGWIAVDRGQLARAAEISLTRVKRVLGFLLLCRVIEARPDGIRILDWQRLCRLGSYDPHWAALPEGQGGEDDAEVEAVAARPPQPAFTASGDPARFV